MLSKILKKTIALILFFAITSSSFLPYFQGPFKPRTTYADSCSSSGDGQQSTSSTSRPKHVARVGGVALDQAAKFLADMTDITGAYYDQNLDRIVFVGKTNTSAPKFDKDDLAVAIKVIVFENNLPWFSLEGNPNDPNLIDAVYSSKSLVDTKFGKVLFDSDYQLKKYILGEDVNGQAVTSSVPGFKSFAQIFIESRSTGSGNSSRWWITPEYISLKKDDASSAFVFETVKMQVKTEATSPNNDPKWTAAASVFAQYQTDHFDEFAQESPSYAAVKQLGKIAAVVKWIKDADIATDFYWARDYAPKIVPTQRSTQKFPPVTYSFQEGNFTYSGSLSGGVDLATSNEYLNDTTGDSAATKNASQAIPTTKEDIHWTFTKDGQQYQAVAVAADAFRSVGSYNTSVSDMSFDTSGDLSLFFKRSYSSFSGGQYGIGRGWTIYPATLYDNDPLTYFTCSGINRPRALALVSSSGGFESFTITNCTTGYVPDDPSYNSKLIRNTDGTFTARLTDQTEFMFDSLFRLIKIKDKVGNTITYNYQGSEKKLLNIDDGKGHKITMTYGNFDGIELISQVTDWSGRSIKYSYDNQGNLLSVTDPNNNVTKYTYDANFKLINIIDRNNNSVLTNTYTDEAKIVTQKNAANITSAQTYDPAVRKVTVTDDQSPTRTNIANYDVKGRLLEQKDTVGSSVKFTYGPEMPPLTITNKNGNKITNTYDANANLTSVTYPDGKIVTYTYDTKNRLTKISDPRYTTTKTTSYSYSTANTLSSVNEAGRTTNFTYDGFGELLTLTDPLSRKTSWTKDSMGNKLTETDPSSNVTKYDYDVIGRLLKLTDADLKATSYTYDGNGNLITLQTSAGTTSNSYDKENRLIKTVLPNSAVTDFSYNNLGSLTGVKDAVETTTSYGLDAYQNLVSRTNGLNNTTTYQYDSLNRKTQEKTPLSKEAKWEYDANGNILKRIDANGNSVVYAYDAFNRLTKITYPDGKSVTNTYDSRGNLVKMIDSIGTSTYTYDNFDRLIKAINPFNNTLTYTYNNVDKVTKITYPDGKSASYSYDNSHRLTKVTDWNLKSTAYAYNKNNTRATRTYPNSVKTTYDYDSSNRLIGITHSKSTTTLAKFTYSRDNIGNITQAKEEGTFILTPKPIATPTPTPSPTPTPTPGATSSADLVITNVTVSPANPAANQAFTITTTIKNQGSERAYGPSVRIAFYYDNPVAPTYETTYNDFNNISVDLAPGQSMQNVMTWARFPSSGTHLVYVMIDREKGIAESNDNNNLFGPVQVNVLAKANLLQKALSFFAKLIPTQKAIAQTAPFITDFSYDLLGRLTSVKYPDNGTYSYTFDKADNRLSETLNGTAKNFTYDQDDKLGQGGILTYYYDNNGNQIMRTQTGLQENNKYKYDFENRLIQYIMPNANTHNYRYDGLGNRLEKEFGGAISRWVYDNSGELSRLISTSANTYLYGNGTDLISQGDDSSSFRKYYLEDGLGNTRFLADSSGNKSKSYDYDPYGNIRNESGIYDALFQFQAQQYDDIMSFYYLRARMYDPSIGRFISADPLEGTLTNPQSQNPYAYALNNPVNLSDPSGEQVAEFIQMCIRAATIVGTKASSLFQRTAPLATKAPSIKNIDPRMRHVIESHTVGGSNTAGKSIFNEGENINKLIQQAERISPVKQPGGNYERVIDVGRKIGIDRGSGSPTSTYTVITDPLGNFVTAFPGAP